jgi:predicted nucleic acid-binding protein
VLIDVESNISIKAAYDSTKYNLHAVDALIYRSAIENKASLVTMDYDFECLPGVRIVKQGKG